MTATPATIAGALRGQPVRGHRLCCPECGGRDIAWGPLDAEGERLVLQCQGCKVWWSDTKELALAERDDGAGRMP